MISSTPSPSAPIGSVGAVIDPTAGPEYARTLRMLDDLGFDTIWLSGGALTGMDQVTAALSTIGAHEVSGSAGASGAHEVSGSTGASGASGRARIGTAILAVDRYDVDTVAGALQGVDQAYRERLVLGIGGAHGPRPLGTLRAYLDRLDPVVPVERRMLAALGDRMLELARDRTAGALPVLVDPAYTRHAREVLGDGAALAVEQFVTLETDPTKARELARQPLSFLRSIPGYADNFRRMGYRSAEIDELSDRLVDGLVAWGTPETIAARVDEHREAGADHVAVLPIDRQLDEDGWRKLAVALGACRPA